MRYVFGPVPSRRLGLSLGVDLVPFKVCSFDCVYCECGRTTLKTIERKEYVPIEEVKRELDALFTSEVVFDYVTFSGFGEPLLNAGFFKVASWIKERIHTPLAVLTNSSLFIFEEVRKEASLCDYVLPSLDAAYDDTFYRINRPVEGLKVKDIAESLAKFRREFPHVRMGLEVLFVKGINDTEREVEGLKSLIEYIEPHEIHLNTVVRPPADDVDAVDDGFLHDVASFFGGRAVVIGKNSCSISLSKMALVEAVLDTVKRRPLTAEDIASLVGEDKRVVDKIIEELLRSGELEEVRFSGRKFYKIAEKSFKGGG